MGLEDHDCRRISSFSSLSLSSVGREIRHRRSAGRRRISWLTLWIRRIWRLIRIRYCCKTTHFVASYMLEVPVSTNWEKCNWFIKLHKSLANNLTALCNAFLRKCEKFSLNAVAVSPISAAITTWSVGRRRPSQSEQVVYLENGLT